MNLQVLIDSIVRQMTVLIAQLSTARGLRAPLANVANQVFLDLAEELHQQGVSRKVSADMFGLALRTYLRKIQRLSESSTEQGRSLWQAVLEYLQRHDLLTRAEVLQHFCRDDSQVVAGVLQDLSDTGLVYRAGAGPATSYRAATQAELGRVSEAGAGVGFDELIWAIVYREGPLSGEALARITRQAELETVISRLLAAGRIQSEVRGTETVYSAKDLFIPRYSPVGWEAAVFDHFQAVVQTIAARLTTEAEARSDLVGGSTYSLEVWPGHPYEQEALAQLGQFRERTSALRAKIRQHNQEHPRGSDVIHITVYGGQCVVREQREESSDV
ncbi:MAG: hypothetical protein JW940_23030 [Polyangiaceae bacterium]|nr:hypothetical protein [Polyangiaceae bacterium]